MSARRPTLKHRAEYAAFRALLGGAALLGDERAARAAEALGRAVYHGTGVRRDVVHANLRRAFPERDEAWIRATAAATYAHVAREAVLAFRRGDWDAERLRHIIRIDGLEAVERATRAGQGAVIAAGHFGNWEFGAKGLPAYGVPTDAVAQRQRNPLFDAMLTETRSRLGADIIDRRVAARGALRALRKGRAVVFVIDQNAGRHGDFVPFFGVPASTHRGAALLAVRSESPMFASRCIRTAEGRYDLKVEELAVDRAGDTDDVVRRLTAAFTSWLEAEIRLAPEQYFWLHRRWKTRPPEERKNV